MGVITTSTSQTNPSSKVTFSAANSTAREMRTAAFDTVNQKVVVAYLDGTNTNGMAGTGTVNGIV